MARVILSDLFTAEWLADGTLRLRELEEYGFVSERLDISPEKFDELVRARPSTQAPASASGAPPVPECRECGTRLKFSLDPTPGWTCPWCAPKQEEKT